MQSLRNTSTGQTRSWTIDPAGRRRAMTDSTVSGSTISHYDSSDDNPAWITEPNGTVSTYTSGLNGSLAAGTTTSGTTTSTSYQLVNLHGDVTTTVAAGTTSLSASQDTDEYGNPRNTTTLRYGWLGAHQRSGDALGGLLLMGVRLYNPYSGRFLQPDPVLGGGANAYAYPTDPIGGVDLDGRVWGPIASGAGWACARVCAPVGRAAGGAARYVGGKAKSAGRAVVTAAQLQYRARLARANWKRLRLTDSAAKKGRSYQRNQLLIRQILQTRPMADPQGARGTVMFRAPGSYNGSRGVYELIVHPGNNRIYHFLFISR